MVNRQTNVNPSLVFFLRFKPEMFHNWMVYHITFYFKNIYKCLLLAICCFFKQILDWIIYCYWIPLFFLLVKYFYLYFCDIFGFLNVGFQLIFWKFGKAFNFEPSCLFACFDDFDIFLTFSNTMLSCFYKSFWKYLHFKI